MKPLLAFTKKEFIELHRIGKFWILFIISILFGIMNPFIAKLTPWLMETVSGSMSDVGITMTEMKIDALTSWTQFYKNIPMLLIIFVIMMSGIMVNEYQKGTFINILTKGLQRWKIIIAKAIAMTGVWTICYGVCFLITYSYNAYFWDNSIAVHIVFGAFCVYLLGIWVITLILLMSSLWNTSYAVLGMIGGIFVLSYFMSLVSIIQSYLPTQLFSAMSILTQMSSIDDFINAILGVGILSTLNIIVSILVFNKKAI